MKVLMFIALASVCSLSWIVCSLANNVREFNSAYTERLSTVMREANEMKTRTSRNESCTDIAVSHLSKSSHKELTYALNKASIYGYEKLVPSYYGGFNAVIKKKNEFEGEYEECVFWAKIDAFGNLDIQKCKKDINSDF
jgi:hypothetical protein